MKLGLALFLASREGRAGLMYTWNLVEGRTGLVFGIQMKVGDLYMESR